MLSEYGSENGQSLPSLSLDRYHRMICAFSSARLKALVSLILARVFMNFSWELQIWNPKREWDDTVTNRMDEFDVVSFDER